MSPTKSLAVLTLGLLSLPLAAEPGMYASFAYGNASVDDDRYQGVPGLAFAGPTVDHDICSTTATITIGAQPQVTDFDGRDTQYRFSVGWRGEGALAWELGYFNLARVESGARRGPYAVAQPACPDFTVSAEGVKLERLSASGISFGPVYHIPLGGSFELELRANLNLYDLRSEAQWLVEVTEFNAAGDALRTYPTAGVNGQRDESGTDLGLGLGLSYTVNDKARVRLSAERQVAGQVTLEILMLGLVLGF